ncbi:MAG: antirestriction protein ArdA [Arcobacteraceae bacterium]|nr:antirestriction protein ArdA [Arcobacteraceae bacterium]
MISIYITDLAAYNSGYLIGEWVKLPIPEKSLLDKINQILTTGANVCNYGFHEEIFITDYEFECSEIFQIDEYDSVLDLNEKALKLQELNEHQLKAVSFLMGQSIVSELDEAIEKSDEVIIHTDLTMFDVACSFIEECYGEVISALPSIILDAINYNYIASELELDGYVEIDGDVYEYHN